jgi:hypothetical protein
MKYITKAISQLSKVSRGLDRSHPEYEPKDQDKLANYLRRAIKAVHKLERNHDELRTDICSVHNMLTELMVDVKDKHIPHEEIVNRLLEILNDGDR